MYTFKMASTGTHWETVGKSSKKAKTQGQPGGQSKKKLNPDNMPRIESARKDDPLILSRELASQL